MSQRIFVIGATGYVGGALATHLKVKGHDVSGLARSDRSAEKLTSMGIRAIPGDVLEDPSPVLAFAASVDTIIYAAQVRLTGSHTLYGLSATRSPALARR